MSDAGGRLIKSAKQAADIIESKVSRAAVLRARVADRDARISALEQQLREARNAPLEGSKRRLSFLEEYTAEELEIAVAHLTVEQRETLRRFLWPDAAAIRAMKGE